MDRRQLVLGFFLSVCLPVILLFPVWELLEMICAECFYPGERLGKFAGSILLGAAAGGINGFFQYRVLRTRFSGLKPWPWRTGHTLLGACIATVLSMDLILFDPGVPEVDPWVGTSPPGPLVWAFIAIIPGFLTGLLTGFMDWMEIRKYQNLAGAWVAKSGIIYAFAGVTLTLFAALGATQEADFIVRYLLLLAGAISSASVTTYLVLKHWSDRS